MAGLRPRLPRCAIECLKPRELFVAADEKDSLKPEHIEIAATVVAVRWQGNHSQFGVVPDSRRLPGRHFPFAGSHKPKLLPSYHRDIPFPPVLADQALSYFVLPPARSLLAADADT